MLYEVITEEADVDPRRANGHRGTISGRIDSLGLDEARAVLHAWERVGHRDGPHSGLGPEATHDLTLSRLV